MFQDPDRSRVRALANQLGAGVFVLDVEADGEFRFVAINVALERLSGLRNEDLAGRRVDECLEAGTAEQVVANYARCVALGETLEYEERLWLPAGETWWRTTLTPLSAPDGSRIVRLVGTAAEMGEAQRSRRLGRRKTELLEAAAALAGVAHWRFELGTGERIWSAEMLRIHGLAPGEEPPPPEEVESLYHPGDWRALQRQVARAVATGKPFRFEARLRDRGEGERHLRGLGRLEHDEDGQPLAIFGVLRDVTEERRQQEALLERERRLRRLYDATPAMLLSTDAEGRLASASDRWLDRMGYAREEVLGRSVLDFVAVPADRRARARLRAELRDQGEIRRVECSFRRRDGGTVEVMLSSVAEHDAVGRIEGFLTVLVDVTGRKAAERELARTQQILTDALESMRDAVMLFDPEGRLLIHNKRIKELYPLIADLVQPGLSYRDMMRAMVDRGQYRLGPGQDLEDWLDQQVAEQQDCPRDYEIHLSDGRWVQVSTRRTSDGGVVSTRRDLTQRKQMEFALAHMAMHDALTDLPNRSMFREELERAIARARRDRTRFAVLLGDLDGFKAVNDSLGHGAGDRLLVEVGRRLMGGVRGGDLVARLAGDEFAILAFANDAGNGFGALADRLVDLFRSPFDIDGNAVMAGLSLGIAVYPDHAADAEQLLINADLALYVAKRSGRRSWRSFERGMAGTAPAAASLETALRSAIARDELLLHYQPILELDTGRPIGAEALLRWRHPTRGLLSAGAFLPATDHRPVIMAVTRWTIAEALRQQRAWDGERGIDLSVWVNLAARSFRWNGLVQTVEDELERSGVPADRLVLEITEGSFADLFRAENQIAALQAMGVRIALDDFGVGHSSLARLRDVSVDVLKIDRTFVANLAANGRDDAIVHTIIALGASLGVATLAEGIETAAQCDMLRKLGCRWGQGYHFARPMPPQAFLDWVVAHSPAPERRATAFLTS